MSVRTLPNEKFTASCMKASPIRNSGCDEYGLSMKVPLVVPSLSRRNVTSSLMLHTSALVTVPVLSALVCSDAIWRSGPMIDSREHSPFAAVGAQ